MNKPSRIGLVFCRCGPNIGERIRLNQLIKESAWPESAWVGEHSVLCSEEGRIWLSRQIREERLDRLVVAGCSPREHLLTFQAVLSESGLNPYLIQMANIREQCEWVGGTPDQATLKARALVRAALRRVALHEPLELKSLECNPDVLVVGSGVAGISAALALIQKSRRVILLERAHVLGGRVALLDEIVPSMECASCFMEPALDRVLHDEGVRVITGADILEVRGYYGNFSVRIEKRPRRVDAESCLGCGSCTQVCPSAVEDELSAGFSMRKAISMPYVGCLPHVSVVDEEACLRSRGEECDACAQACPFGAVRLQESAQEEEIRAGAIVLATGSRPEPAPAAPGLPGAVSCLELERMLHPNGPTSGTVRMRDGRIPASVLLAVAERAGDEGEMAWAEVIKLAWRVKQKLPSCQITLAGGSPRVGGPIASLGRELAASGAVFLQGQLRGAIRRTDSGDSVCATLDDGKFLSDVEADMVVVYTRSVPAPESTNLSNILRVKRRRDGFYEDEAGPFEPAASSIAGIYVAGCAGGPRSIAASIRDGAAASARILSRLIPGERIALETMVAEVDETRCSSCGTCRAACPFGAVVVAPEKGVSEVITALCRGCGTCAAACPSGAISATHFTDEQISREIVALFAEDSHRGGM